LQYLPAGIGALFFSVSPLFMALFAALLLGERITKLAAAGLVLGFAGMGLLVAPSTGGTLPAVAVVAGVACAISWALGSIVQRRLPPRDVVQASAMQMLCAAVLLAGVGAISGERFAPHAIVPEALWAFAFLVFGGSIVGYSCYLWLLHNVPAVIASTYAYVNPIVALIIAVLFLHEPFSWRTAVAGLVIVAGVALIMATRGGPQAPGPQVGGLRAPTRQTMPS
jgi:drug/metabolite transporter (DMT)-like permease